MNTRCKFFLLVFSALLVLLSKANSAVSTNNFNFDFDAAYGLFASDGNLLQLSSDTTIRLGYSTLSNAQIVDAFTAGDLLAIDNSFTAYGLPFGLDINDGIFLGGPTAPTFDGFTGELMVLWVSTELTFTSNSAEYLIYRFNVAFPEVAPAPDALLGTTPGTLLVGGYGNYSHDYGYGGGPLPGFNTVAVPEPHYGALLLGLGALGYLIVRRRRAAME